MLVPSEYVGHKFGRWSVLEVIRIKRRSHYRVQCECGHISTPAAYQVIKGFSSACKYCAPKKHGHYNTPTNRSWNGARNRCNNPKNKDYCNYGARGIIFSEEWNNFEVFLKYMGERPHSMTLDRIDNNGHYEPGNCRWATISEQNSNQRKRSSLKIKGV
jgi:hypothetical protein